ncbi:MAG: ribonuclease HII [Ilumatobacteraceae bacterium]
MASASPTLDVERELFASGARLVAGVDEVGRGALAGPVTIGIVCIDASCVEVPDGLRDSKLMTPKRRDAMEATVKSWARAWSLGEASADEIDRLGIMGALSLAAARALAALAATPDWIILDGTVPFLMEEAHGPRVMTRAKADRDCASVAAASVVAKVSRDRLMAGLHETNPVYGWDANKGYGAAVHTAAIREHGLSDLHRRSWNIG